MTDLIPPFDFNRVIIAPWTDGFASFGWIALMGFFVAASCGLVGNYLILRRMSLVGDAISHSILPGIAIAFLLANSRSTTAMFIGALVAGVFTTVIIELIHKKSRVKQDAAIGIAFTTLFAIGVILISLYASKVDLDQECDLYGEVAFVWINTAMVWRMAIVAALTVILIALFYKELLVSSFEAVGAILVIAMLILPGATASLWSTRLTVILWLSVLDAALSSVVGFHLAVWLGCSTAGAMVVVAALLFVVTWVISPSQGLIH